MRDEVGELQVRELKGGQVLLEPPRFVRRHRLRRARRAGHAGAPAHQGVVVGAVRSGRGGKRADDPAQSHAIERADRSARRSHAIIPAQERQRARRPNSFCLRRRGRHHRRRHVARLGQPGASRPAKRRYAARR